MVFVPKAAKWVKEGVNIGVQASRGPEKRGGSREGIIDICGAGKCTGSFSSLALVTCGNGEHEFGQLTDEFV